MFLQHVSIARFSLLLHTNIRAVASCQSWTLPDLSISRGRRFILAGVVPWHVYRNPISRTDCSRVAHPFAQGLAALLVRGLSGCTPDEIVSVDPVFIEKLGLKQSLTPSRNNGFLNMFRLMQRRALEYAQAQVSFGGDPVQGDCMRGARGRFALSTE